MSTACIPGAHTKEKPSKISNITCAILFFHQKKIKHTLESTSLDETKKVKVQNTELFNLKCVT